MSGHGALTAALRHPDRYRAASAFAPIVAPSRVPWGIKALGGYLGADRAAWRKHDAVALIEDGARFSDFLVDCGEADPVAVKRERFGHILDTQHYDSNLHDSLRLIGASIT